MALARCIPGKFLGVGCHCFTFIYIYIYIYIYKCDTCILLATCWQVQRRLFGNTLVTGQRQQLLPNRTTIPLQYMFPCRNNNAQNGASNLTTSSLTKHSKHSLPTTAWQQPHTHTPTRAHAQWKLITLAGVKGFHTNKYPQKTEGIARSIIWRIILKYFIH